MDDDSRVGIHVSDMNTFRACRRQWDFTSLLRRGLEPIRPYKPFVLGRAVHWCLQQYYDHGCIVRPEAFLDEYVNLNRDQFDDIPEIDIATVHGMLSGYVAYHAMKRTMFYDENLEFLALETSFRIPMIDPDTGMEHQEAVLEGRFDGLVRRRDDGSLWVIEHKTAADIARLQNTLFNVEQAGVYTVAAEYLFGQDVSGILYNILAKKVPTEPRVLKSGTLSLDRGINTTLSKYTECIYRVHGEDADPKMLRNLYGDHLLWLATENADDKFFRRIPVVRTPQELISLRRRVWQVTCEMLSDKTPMYNNPGWYTCTFCSFKVPCMMLENGRDISEVVEREFRKRPIWDDEEGHEIGGGNEKNNTCK